MFCPTLILFFMALHFIWEIRLLLNSYSESPTRVKYFQIRKTDTSFKEHCCNVCVALFITVNLLNTQSNVSEKLLLFMLFHCSLAVGLNIRSQRSSHCPDSSLWKWYKTSRSQCRCCGRPLLSWWKEAWAPGSEMVAVTYLWTRIIRMVLQPISISGVAGSI